MEWRLLALVMAILAGGVGVLVLFLG